MQQPGKIIVLLNKETDIEDRYVLSSQHIGEGRFARVYKAQSLTDPSKIFAVKVLQIRSQESKRQFLSELNIIKNLPDCLNLVKIHKNHFQSERNIYIFQEYCESGNLAAYRASKGEVPLQEDEIYDLFAQTCTGLICLLQAGIVHEDIKPANILKKGNLFKLCDFGVSEIQKQCKQSTTRTGTVSYMPPQKLRSRKFLPNQKSDIFSLGVCLYEVIFGFHPYLSQKTLNYKEYLAALNPSSLRPIHQLMQVLGSSSLRLQNLLRFLEKMINLNVRKRASLAELKTFLKTTEPFKSMKISEEKIVIVSQIKVNGDVKLEQSIVPFSRNHENELQVITQKGGSEKEAELVKSQQDMYDPLVHEEQSDSTKIREAFIRQNEVVRNIISYLIRGVEYIRRSNFNEMNILPTMSNFLNIDLKQCKSSRFLKYLVFELVIGVKRRQREVYGQYLDEVQEQRLHLDISYLENQFHNFLIQCSFSNKEILATELNKLDVLQVWTQIVVILQHSCNSLSIIKENKKDFLQSIIFSSAMPTILSQMSKCLTIYFSHPHLPTNFNYKQHSAAISDLNRQLMKALEMENEKMERVRSEIERILQQKKIQVLFDIQEESEEIEIIEEEDLV